MSVLSDARRYKWLQKRLTLADILGLEVRNSTYYTPDYTNRLDEIIDILMVRETHGVMKKEVDLYIASLTVKEKEDIRERFRNYPERDQYKGGENGFLQWLPKFAQAQIELEWLYNPDLLSNICDKVGEQNE